MSEKLKKEPRIVRYAVGLLICCLVIALVGNIFVSSTEMTINAQTKKVNDEITNLQSDIDGLEIQKSQLASFSRLKRVASAKGYKYKQGSTAAAVVTDEKNN